MDSLHIRGGRRLRGVVEISGSKNSTLPLMAASLMAEGTSKLRRAPKLHDVESMAELLGDLGATVKRHAPPPSASGGPAIDGMLEICVTDPNRSEADYDTVSAMRASICVLGPLLAKRGKAVVSIPGGCKIGNRPVDLHLKGLARLGAEFHAESGNIVGRVKGRLKGCTLFLGGAQGPTVLGTINVMSAATLAEGKTTIVGAACEPEVADTANFLNKMGARITGHGTPEITIEGVDSLKGCEHEVIPDRIETGTFMIAAAITNGELLLKNCTLKHLVAFVDCLGEIGVDVAAKGNDIVVSSARRLRPVEISTQPYPGFPTDLQAQLMALLCLADGNSVITERIYPDRFLHVAELSRLGAAIRKEGPTAIVQGVKELQGAEIVASDLRASAALVLAGLAAKDTTCINQVHHIDRGYEVIEKKLEAVGADIQRVTTPGRSPCD